MISCILLSAGLSRRFGSPKALARLNQQTVVEYILNILIDSKLSEIIVVLGDRYQEIKPYILNHEKVKVVYNKDYIFGQTSSFKAGLRNVSKECRGVMLLPVDMPAVKGETIDRIIDKFLSGNFSFLIPSYQRKRGHPPVFGAQFKEQLLQWDDKKGLNEFERKYNGQTVCLPVDDKGILLSFNTPEEFEAVKSYLALGPA
ncbi:MAG TPA: nucleotidyltransferase family protein [Candidatus Omnitrophota bacterium]|nr:nucleotidyltransferase family protein [Candidatus Omnitrophota bacterium]HPD85213.1 nucleotidyltransferase family protein [Candidatus Omnitrophota bacterium]HRZ04286.1 nucleotidyltransferase family protein [Candidatus Omnitrophota bacterium]